MNESVSINEARKLTDQLAAELERKGLWRRAATRWLEVMYQTRRAQRQRCAAITVREFLAAQSLWIIRLKDD